MNSLWLDHAPPLASDRLPTDHDVHDVVVGAGLTGLATAVLLAHAGRDVVVLEARHIGAGTTGNTTAKVSLLQGTKLSRLLESRSHDDVADYVAANHGAMRWLLRFCDEHGVRVDRRHAVTYAAVESEIEAVRREHDAARLLGLDVEWHEQLDVPFPHHGATVLADQAAFDPIEVLHALAQEIRRLGGRIVEGTRVVGVPSGGRGAVELADGSSLRASSVTLATGSPIVDRGLHFARLEAHRSYALALHHDAVPSGMYLSAGSRSARSVRDATSSDGTRALLVGGQGHVVGRTASERAHLDELRRWTHQHFPGAVETHAWSAQDHRSLDGLPQVGTFRGGGPYLRIATGYDKWGMASAVAAGHLIAAEICDEPAPWAQRWQARRLGSHSVRQAFRTNAGVAAAGARSFASALSHPVSARPAEGSADVGRATPRLPAAVSTVSGTTCRVSAICTHLGGALRWNDAEESWDCPLHGSRFAPDGSVLEGPATTPLANRST